MSRAENAYAGRAYKRGDSGSPVMRFIVVMFFVILFVVCASMYISQNDSLARVSSKAEQLAEKQEAVILENEEAKNVQKKVGTDEYTEEMARDQLGMVKTGETIFDTDGK